MAKHWVKCSVCDRTFDASTEPYVKTSSRRYAHKVCAEKLEAEKSKEQRDKETLESYIKELFSIDSITPKIKRQIETYMSQYNYTYSGMFKTLKYFFDVRGNSIEKANEGIGIVPYVYAEAFSYWRALWEAQQRNMGVEIDEYVLPQKEIHIKAPEREPMRRMKPLFSFLDEEGEDQIAE